ncbi:MAG: transcription antitermination factor NusB [Tissierellia bacterium]|nr:transcription antitermination factor NusB [Tissierellia bacterium]
MSRKNAREGLMKLLYESSIQNEYSYEIMKLFLNNNDYKLSESKYIEQIYTDMISKICELDNMIESDLKGWAIERIPKVDLSVLRIALYELLYKKDIPAEVSINEAVEIARKYSRDDSPKFINGILGNILRNRLNNTKPE